MNLNNTKEKILNSLPGILSDDNLGTKKYHHVQTWDLIESFGKIGYEVIRWDMQHSKNDGKHAPHMIEMVLKSKQYRIGNDVVNPQVIILNSYNAKQALRIKFGVFYSNSQKMSLWFSNALERSRIVHKGEKVDALVAEVHEAIEKQMETLDFETYSKILNDSEKKNFVKGLLQTKFGKRVSCLRQEAFLEPMHDDTDLSTAWGVYQNVVERIMTGLYIVYRNTEDGYKKATQMQGKKIRKFTVAGNLQEKMLEKMKEMMQKK